ncbi:MAG: hypothetical protein LBR39_02025 [Coriobacteriales bacterium]|nr:hypothetical protein [Coriobacteriales bacterium]
MGEGKTTSGSAFATRWTLLIMAGVLLEFVGRLIGYANNPMHYYHPFVAALTTISAAVLVIVGFFRFNGARAVRLSAGQRSGIALMVMGGFMLLASFASKEMIPLIFG